MNAHATPDSARRPSRSTGSLVGATDLLRLAAAPLVAAALLAAALPAAAQEGPVQLRLDAQEGETLTYEFDSELRVQFPPELMQGEDPEQRMEASLVVSQRTESVGEDTLTFASTIEDYTVDLQMPGMDESARDQVRQGIEAMKGSRFEMRVTRNGTIADVSYMDDGQSPGTSQLEQSFRQVGFPYLPPEPVEIGESWTSEQRLEAASLGVPLPGEIVISSTTTLRDLSREGDATMADLVVESTFDFRPSSETQGMEIQMNGSSAQNLRFDVTRGQLVNGSGAQDFTINLSMPGQGSLSIQGSGQQSSRLVK